MSSTISISYPSLTPARIVIVQHVATQCIAKLSYLSEDNLDERLLIERDLAKYIFEDSTPAKLALYDPLENTNTYLLNATSFLHDASQFAICSALARQQTLKEEYHLYDTNTNTNTNTTTPFDEAAQFSKIQADIDKYIFNAHTLPRKRLPGDALYCPCFDT